MVDINQLIDEVVGQVATEEQSAPATEPTVPTEPQPTVQSAQAPVAPVTPTPPTAQSAQAPVAPVTPIPPPAPSVHSVGDMPISHSAPTDAEDAVQPQSAPTSLPPRQYVPSAHSVGDMPISRPSSYFSAEDEDADTHTDTVPPSTEALYPEVLSSGEVPTEQSVVGDDVSGQATEQGAPNGQQPELVDMDGTTQPDADNPDDPTAQYDTERYNVPRSYQEALRILDLQRSKPIYQSLMEGLGDPDAKRRAIDAYQARRNRYSGLVRLAEAIANTIDASGAQRNAYSERRDPSYRYENDTQRELARQYADLQRTEGMLYNARMRDAARYDRLSAEMRATESAGDQAARNEARYKQQLRQRAADAKRAEEQAKAAAEERAQRAADANAKWQAEMAMRDKQHRDRMGIERAKLAIRRNEQALKAARATAGTGGGSKSSGAGKGSANDYKRIPITLSDRVNGHISVPANNPDYARKFFADNFIESAKKQMEVYNRHHAGDGKTYTSLPEYVQDQYGIDVMPLIGDVQCTPKEYQVAADKAAAIAMRDPETVLSYSVNSPFFGDNGYDADGVQVATDAIRERCGGYLNAISILNAANKSGLTYPQAFAIMYPNIYNSVVSAAQSGNKSDLAGVIKVLADGYNGVTYCRSYKDASQMVSWLLDTDALAERAPGFTEEDWGQ